MRYSVVVPVSGGASRGGPDVRRISSVPPLSSPVSVFGVAAPGAAALPAALVVRHRRSSVRGGANAGRGGPFAGRGQTMRTISSAAASAPPRAVISAARSEASLRSFSTFRPNTSFT